jgi:hypothetical protein
VSATSNDNIYLGVLLFIDRATGMWVAQALEHDISAHGPTIEAAQTAFERVIDGYLKLDAIRHRAPLSAIPRAPQPFWDAWQQVTEKQAQALSVPHAYAIRAITDEAPALTM